MSRHTFAFYLSMSLFPYSQAAPVAILPSALFCERYSLGASWVFSFQKVLLPENRSLFPPFLWEFKREVSKHLTGKETEPWEILYFKAYKSQLPVIEQALETAGLMLGSNKSRGYCLEMICADFLAGVSLEAGNQDALLPCLTRLVVGLPKPQRKQLLEEVQVTF